MKAKLINAVFFIFFTSIFSFSQAFPGEMDDSTKQLDFQVLDGNTSELLYTWLIEKTDRTLEIKKKRFETAIKNPKSLKKFQSELTDPFFYLLSSSFPKEKYPLNPVISRMVDCSSEGYTIENIVIESRKNHHVTGNLYIPADKKNSLPGILMTCGHSRNGKQAIDYQKTCILLVKNGFLVFIVDPVCQGERFQFIDQKITDQLMSSPTIGHSTLDMGANLTGTDIVSYELWDNIRSLDYLLSRPEVDTTRIGLIGNSGGGTQTVYMMSFDDRIDVAVPSCFICSIESLFKGIGPQDGCQQLFGEGAWGFEHVDFLIIRAPKPTKMLAAEKDFFPIEATKKTYLQSKKVFDLLGKPDNLDLFIHPDGHGIHKKSREKAVEWFAWHLQGREIKVEEGDLKPQPDSILFALKNGQVLKSFPNEKSLIQLNLERANQFAGQRNDFWINTAMDSCLNQVCTLLNIEKNQDATSVISKGTTKLDNITIEKVILTGQDNFPIPCLLYIPNKITKRSPAVLFADYRGKNCEFENQGKINDWLKEGNTVLSIDIRGYGETKDDPSKNKYIGGTNADYRNTLISLYLGIPLFGQRVEDMLTAYNFLLNQNSVNKNQITISGIGPTGPIALHAAALVRKVDKLQIYNSIDSWYEMIERPQLKNQISLVVPEALKYYDFEDLINSIGKQKVRFY